MKLLSELFSFGLVPRGSYDLTVKPLPLEVQNDSLCHLHAHERVKIPASPRSTGSESPFSQEPWVPSYIGVWVKPGLSCFWLGFQYWQLESKLKPCLTNRWQRSHILLGNDMKTGQRQLCFYLCNSLGPIRSGALTLSPALCPDWEETPRTHIVNALFGSKEELEETRHSPKVQALYMPFELTSPDKQRQKGHSNGKRASYQESGQIVSCWLAFAQ